MIGRYFYPKIDGEGTITFKDRFTGNITIPTAMQIQLFADLTFANEADVAIISSSLQKYPDGSCHWPAGSDRWPATR